jgi:hypothetical protein
MAGISPNANPLMKLNEGTASVSTGPMGANAGTFTSAFSNDDMGVNNVTVGNPYSANYAGNTSYVTGPLGISIPIDNNDKAQKTSDTLARAYDYDTRYNHPNVTVYNYNNPSNPIKRDESGNFYQDVPSVNGSIGGRNYDFDYQGNNRSAPGYDASTLPGFSDRIGNFSSSLGNAIKTMPSAIGNTFKNINPPLGGKSAAELRQQADMNTALSANLAAHQAQAQAVAAQDLRDKQSSGSASLAASTRAQLGKTHSGSKKSTTSSNVGSSHNNSGYY